jgi:hypothetical protein
VTENARKDFSLAFFLQVLNLFLALVVNSFSHEDSPVSQPGEKVISRMLKAALAVSLNVLKRAQVHPRDETSDESLQERKNTGTTGEFDHTIPYHTKPYYIIPSHTIPSQTIPAIKQSNQLTKYDFI